MQKKCFSLILFALLWALLLGACFPAGAEVTVDVLSGDVPFLALFVKYILLIIMIFFY